MNSKFFEITKSLNFGTGLMMLNLFAKSLPNILPADQSDLLCLIESLNKWDRQLNLVPIKPLLLKYFSQLFKFSLTLLASGDSEYFRYGSDFSVTQNSDILSSSLPSLPFLLSSSDDLSLFNRNIKYYLDQKFDPNGKIFIRLLIICLLGFLCMYYCLVSIVG